MNVSIDNGLGNAAASEAMRHAMVASQLRTAAVDDPRVVAAIAQVKKHVDANDEIYRRNFDIADKVIDGRYGYYRPAGGFYLWLDVGDGETFTKKLWAEQAIKVLPGVMSEVTVVVEPKG